MNQNIKNKHKRRQLDGILLLDKPIEITSNQILQRVKHIYNANKAGHSGTLDPMATGLLPICFGEATKFTSQLLDSNKTYQFTCQLGEKTSTGDKDGTVIDTRAIPNLTQEGLEESLQAFRGKLSQIPPMVSALHHQGKRLYELAREGIEVEREPRSIIIFDLQLNSFDSSSFTATVTCSKGTYVRVLAEDVAMHLNTLGHLTYLRRLSISPFINPDLISYDKLIEYSDQYDLLDDLLLPIDSALCNLPKWMFSKEETTRILHGQRIRVEEELTESLYRLYSEDNQFLGIGAPNTPYSIGAKRIIQNKIN